MPVWRGRRMVERVGLLAVLLGACGCGGGPSGGSPATQADMPSQDACLEWAWRLEDSVARGSVKAFNTCFDWDAFVATATRGFEDAKVSRKAFRRGFDEGMTSRTGFAASLCANRRGEVKYNFLRLHDVDGKRHALFRSIMPDGQVDYHDHVLARQPGGRAISVDLFVFLGGEKLSDTFRKLFVRAVAAHSRSLLGRLTEREGQLIAKSEEIEAMTVLLQDGLPRDALDIYKSLPPSVQRERQVLVVGLEAAARVGENDYRQAMTNLDKLSKDDPSIYLLLIDQYAFGRQFAKAMECVDRLDKALGGDPYLDTLRATYFMEEDQYELARKFASRAMEDPNVTEEAYMVLMTMSLRRRDHDETSRLLDVLERRYHVEIGDLATLPGYTEYVQSPQYRAWFEKHAAKP
ncbi:MAG: hypothetical protein JW809_13300 [Pirellulales bacterium]|nr:hypothetical protein [Pirellulales bacterium]